MDRQQWLQTAVPGTRALPWQGLLPTPLTATHSHLLQHREPGLCVRDVLECLGCAEQGVEWGGEGECVN